MKEKLIAWLNSQVGYHEGANNSNRYAPKVTAAIGWDAQCQPWCAIFVVCAFVECFGMDMACRMLRGCIGGIYAACRQNYERFRCAGQLCAEPQECDVVYFYVGGEVNHEGIVVNVTEKTIDTIEGNSGDGVKRNTYYRTDCSIAGYGRPAWPSEEQEDTECNDGTEDIIHHAGKRRNYLHLEYGDGLNNPLPRVKAWQNHLIEWGYVLDADGEFGSITKSVTMMWQQDINDKYGTDLPVTGTVNEDDWKEIINIPED